MDVGPTLHQLIVDIARAAGFSEELPSVEKLLGDGSERRFFRLRNRTRSAVLLLSPRRNVPGLDENDSYWLIGRHLSERGLPVPHFYWTDAAQGIFLLEDLGDVHLQARARRLRGNLLPLYGEVVKLLVELHRRTPVGFEEGYCFDRAVYDPAFVYERELEYFRTRFLNGLLGLEVAPDDLRRDFEDLAAAAGTVSRTHVIHRDFQSRNIMIRAQALRLIDFQGMRFGPPAYDLASVLIDPYVGISQDLERKLIGRYWVKAGKDLACSFGAFLDSYSVLRLCRNLQMLGAFGFLGVVRGKRQFLRYIPQAWRQLHFWVNHFAGGRYPALRRLVNRIDRRQPWVRGEGADGKVLRDKLARKGHNVFLLDK